MPASSRDTARMDTSNSAQSRTAHHRPARLSTYTELARGGLTHDAIVRLVETGELRRVRTGVYAHSADDSGPGGRRSAEPAHERRRRELVERTLAAARATEPGTVFSHASALALYGLPLHGISLGRPTATRHREGSGSRRSSALTVANLPLDDGVVEILDGIPVTSPARTIIDVARSSGLESGVCAADQAIRWGLCTRFDLQAQADAAKGRTGVARARALPERTSGLAESVLETLIRLILVLAGLPEPELQVRLQVRSGKRFRVDFFWPQWRLIGEADGFGKYGTDPEEIRQSWLAERHRQTQLEEVGYVVIRWTWADLKDPGRIVRRVREEMRKQEQLGFGPAVA